MFNFVHDYKAAPINHPNFQIMNWEKFSSYILVNVVSLDHTLLLDFASPLTIHVQNTLRL